MKECGVSLNKVIRSGSKEGKKKIKKSYVN